MVVQPVMADTFSHLPDPLPETTILLVHFAAVNCRQMALHTVVSLSRLSALYTIYVAPLSFLPKRLSNCGGDCPS